MAVLALASCFTSSGGAGAHVVTEGSAGIAAGAGMGHITAGPDGNLDAALVA
jgi:hypothetical protein